MRALVAAALLALAGPAVARAADAGGGTAPASAADYRGRLTILTIRQAADGSAIVRATIAARCGVARVTSRVKPAADGSFSFTTTVRDRAPEDPRVRRVAAVAVSGRFAAPVATGTATARVKLVRHGRTVDRCKSGSRAWQARTVTAQTVAGPPRANGAYYGLVAQAGRPRAVLLRISPSGRRIGVAAFQYRLSCRHRAFERDNVTPGGPIAADGTFDLRERFTLRFSNATERFRVRFRGRFTTAGVTGALSVSSVARSLSGAVIDRCRTGGVSYGGAL